MLARIRQVLNFLAGPYIVFWVLPYFMVLLVLGTIEQKYIGLYDAVQTYIYAPLIWWHFIPLPGGGLILLIIFISLLLNFLFSQDWKIEKAGILLSHFGMLLLLIGGGVTYLTKEEGFLYFKEGETSNIFYDYHDRVLSIKNENNQLFIPFNDLKANQVIDIPSQDFSLRVIDTCQNCDVIPVKPKENRKGLAKQVELRAIASELNKEENFSGLTFQLINKNNEGLGTFIALEDFKEYPIFENTSFKVQRAEKQLPFSLTLNDFKKIDYAGSTQAKAFESDVIINDDISNWPFTIKMNAPLRHEGYSFYQSSFDKMDNIEASVLTVVQDKGRLFPYISSIILALGLLLQCIIRYQMKDKKYA